MKPRTAPVRALLTGLLLSAALAGPALAASPTFEEVMAAPDDLALNLAFARAEANAGELLSAAGALERILMAQPDAHQARLLYAAILYRLGDFQGSQQQLKLLDGAQLSDLQNAEKERYRNSIVRREAKVEITGNVSAGMMYEEDALGALATQYDFFALSEEGTAAVFSARVDGLVKLQPEGALALYGSGSLYSKTDVDGPDSDFQRIEALAGVARVARMSGWRAGLVVRHYRLLGDSFMVEYGVSAAANKRLTTATTVYASAEAVEQTYDRPLFDDSRDGSRIDVGVGVSHRFSSRSTVSVGVGYEWKDAEREASAYDSPRLTASYEALLGRGAYLILDGSTRKVEYRAPDFFLFGETREDTRNYARATLGAPLSAFTAAGATGNHLEDIRLEGALSYTQREANLPLADYDSLGAELRLIWRFGR